MNNYELWTKLYYVTIYVCIYGTYMAMQFSNHRMACIMWLPDPRADLDRI